jgi:hypothetical protein
MDSDCAYNSGPTPVVGSVLVDCVWVSQEPTRSDLYLEPGIHTSSLSGAIE